MFSPVFPSMSVDDNGRRERWTIHLRPPGYGGQVGDVSTRDPLSRAVLVSRSSVLANLHAIHRAPPRAQYRIENGESRIRWTPYPAPASPYAAWRPAEGWRHRRRGNALRIGRAYAPERERVRGRPFQGQHTDRRRDCDGGSRARGRFDPAPHEPSVSQGGGRVCMHVPGSVIEYILGVQSD